jgi:hypothetical protein
LSFKGKIEKKRAYGSNDGVLDNGFKLSIHLSQFVVIVRVNFNRFV